MLSGAETLPALFVAASERFADAVALRVKRRGLWQGITWRHHGDTVRAIGLGLLGLGLRRGEHVAILGDNCPEWLQAELAILGAGGISVGIDATNTPAQIAHVLNDGVIRFCFLSRVALLARCVAIAGEVPSLIALIELTSATGHGAGDPRVLDLADVVRQGRARAAAAPGDWAASVRSARAADTALVVYTSGTQGPPKGAMITHGNIVFQLGVLERLLPLDPGDRLLSVLPLSRIAERVLSAYRPLTSGAVVHFPEAPESALADLREVQPTCPFGMPPLWEKLHAMIALRLEEATPVQRGAYGWALALGARAADARLRGHDPPAGLAIAASAARRLVLRNVRRMMGLDRARLLITGGAPIAPELIRWYWALGLTMIESYGQTECTGFATLASPRAPTVGSVGRAAPGTEVALARDGEILIRGPNVFAGYHRRPEDRGTAVRAGWLHTGDSGALDGAGQLWIRERRDERSAGRCGQSHRA